MFVEHVPCSVPQPEWAFLERNPSLPSWPRSVLQMKKVRIGVMGSVSSRTQIGVAAWLAPLGQPL